MQLIRMRYKDYTFFVNPQTLTLSHSRNVVTRSVPFGTSRSRDIGTSPVVVSGRGVFGGENARRGVRELSELFADGGSGYLYLPDSTPIRAFFTKLNVDYSDGDGAIGYSFEFVQDGAVKRRHYDFGYTYAVEGENMYDIANRTGTGVEDIFCLNDKPDLFSVKAGDKIWLR